ncbi:MAG TPA: 4a-hydroxytetrahydrobiopterin dehydratase [Chloroflexota bacterium]|nr:4a-hydroxytetrahydrobiopterin dehydratase [Chloroflexota bacterium]
MAVEDLASKVCIPCMGGVPPLTREEFAPLLAQVPGWQVVDDTKLTRSFSCPDWKTAQAFVVGAGAIAEEAGHHPDLLLRWGEVRAEIYTHKIRGLAEADFILAAKLSRLYEQQHA